MRASRPEVRGRPEPRHVDRRRALRAFLHRLSSGCVNARAVESVAVEPLRQVGPARDRKRRSMTVVRTLFATLVCVCALLTTSRAAEVQVLPTPVPSAPPLPSEKAVVTHHTMQFGGSRIAYTATAGVLVVRNAEDKPLSSMSYVAYTMDHVRDSAHRAVSFIYNGGPGSSTFFLHMGAFGPERVVTTNAMTTPPPPYRLVENESTLLDASDLVFIDAPGTGYGRVPRWPREGGLRHRPGRGGLRELHTAVHHTLRALE